MPEEADLSESNLRGADLSDSSLVQVGLRFAVVVGAKLRAADLRSADMQGAEAANADFTRANLQAADLRLLNARGATFRGANLRDADLTGADLRDADLRGADLTGCRLSLASNEGAALQNVLWDSETRWPNKAIAEWIRGRSDAATEGALAVDVADIDLRASAPLTDDEIAILAFERHWWKYAGAKEQAVRENFDMSATRYYVVLNELIERPAALAHDPMLVRRLLRLRSARERSRSKRAVDFEV